MAVTYAWRLDADKYAYILSPTHTATPHLSSTPLSQNDLNIVASTANDKYVNDKENGLENYRNDFAKMIKAINDKEEWGNAGSYDLLSADIYYNVDAYDCADLRGVGIKGIRFLGTADPNTFDIDNPAWTPIDFPEGMGDVLSVLSGKYSVYGVYMEDQDADNSDPESVFVVYNGKNGTNSDGSQSTADLQARIDDLEEYCKDTEEGIPALSVKYENLENTVNWLSGLDNENIDIAEMAKQVDKNKIAITTEIPNTYVNKETYDKTIEDLISRIDSVERNLPTGGNSIIESVSVYNGDRTAYLLFVNPDTPNKLYYSTEYFIYNGELYAKKLGSATTNSTPAEMLDDNKISVSLYDNTSKEEFCLVLYHPNESTKLYYSRYIILSEGTLKVKGEQINIGDNSYNGAEEQKMTGADFDGVEEALDNVNYYIACYTPHIHYNMYYDMETYVKKGTMYMGAFYEMDK